MRAPAVLALALALTAPLVTSSCSSDDHASRPKKAKKEKPPPPPDHPRTWAEVPEWYGSKCPAPAFKLDEPYKKTVAGASWTIEGTTGARGAAWQGPLVIGVLGAIKDHEGETRENLVKAKAAFDKAGVNIILCNGDVAETSEIHEVADMLTEVFGDSRPILVHSGNSEWTGGFTETFHEAEKKNPAFFNMNFVRDLDVGGVHFVSLPGWSVKQFVKEGGCRYQAEDVDAVRAMIEGIKAKGHLVILTAHGPPRGPDKKSLDATHDYGNVGDEALAKLLQDGVVNFGIFGHILESGGRATDDAKTHKSVALPMKKGLKTLYVNVGSSSSFGIELINKTTSRGMAAIVTIDDIAAGGTAKVNFLTLRK